MADVPEAVKMPDPEVEALRIVAEPLGPDDLPPLDPNPWRDDPPRR